MQQRAASARTSRIFPVGQVAGSRRAYILQAAGREYYADGPGTLSIKTFRGGVARYRAENGARYAVDDDAYLVLNHGQDYTIEIESLVPVESFCLFFREGMAEEVRRSLTALPERLLDEPTEQAAVNFFERTHAHDGTLSPALFSLRHALAALPPDVSPEPVWLTERLHSILERLLLRHLLDHAEVATFGQAAGLARPATREELYRRLHHARDYIAACYMQPVTLEEMAAVACLSPNHFLRTFKAAFHTTPHQYLTHCRLDAARRLLTWTALPVTEVCLEVGFSSPGSFSTLFSRRAGLSPEAYRRREARSR